MKDLRQVILHPHVLEENLFFSAEQEKEIADHILQLAKMFYGLSTMELRKIVFEYAERNQVPNTFNKTDRTAGKEWVHNFLKRNKNISLRKPEATSINRVLAFNKEEIALFYENLDSLMTKFKFEPSRIWNVDETGITTVHKPGHIYAPKGQKQVGAISSGERGKNTTVCCAISASGCYIPPMFIFARLRMTPQLSKNGPPDSIYECSKSGWMTEELFVVWLKHFCRFSNPSKENPVLLIADNHSTHISLSAYELCKSKGIVMLSLPPHTSHRLQPLDVSVYGPLKAAYNRECESYMKSHHNQKITTFEIAELFHKAYGKVASISNAVKGFETSGIYPINKDIFQDYDFPQLEHVENQQNHFVNSAVKSTGNTEEQQAGVEVPEHTESQSAPSTSFTRKKKLEYTEQSSVIANVFKKSKTVKFHPEPSTSSCNAATGDSPEPSTSKIFQDDLVRAKKVSIQDISPLPSVGHIKQKRFTRKKQHSKILTSTPCKEELEEKERKRQNKNEKLPREKKNKMIAKVKRKVLESSSSEDEIAENLCDDESEPDSEFEHQEDICAICGEFGRNGEVWFRCQQCGNWVHRECSGSSKPDGYICDFCKP